MNGKDFAILTILAIASSIFTVLTMITHSVFFLFSVSACIISMVVYLGYMDVRWYIEYRKQPEDDK